MPNQFDKKYKLKPEYIDNPNILKKERYIQEEQIRIQNEIPSRPSNIKYFENLIYNDVETGQWPVSYIAHKRDVKSKPYIGYFCNLIPRELIEAFDAIPLRLDCGNNATATLGEETFSQDICPLARATFGSFLHKDSLANKCDVLIMPTSCDAKRKLGEALNDFKPTFMLNLPTEQSHELYAKKSLEELKRLIKFLEKHLNKKISKKLLLESIKLSLEKTKLIRELQDLKKEKPQSISLRDIFLIIQSSQFKPVDQNVWIDELKKVIDELRKYKVERKSLRPRLILTGAPIVWPNFKIMNILEETGVDLISDTICTGFQSMYDPIVLDEKSLDGMLKALVDRYIYAPICPCFISQTTRINRTLELIEETNSRGVVNYSLRLCPLFDMETYRIEKILKQKKISYINIKTDYSLEDTEQLRVRIEAFIETMY